MNSCCTVPVYSYSSLQHLSNAEYLISSYCREYPCDFAYNFKYSYIKKTVVKKHGAYFLIVLPNPLIFIS
jgi:hypothetical protein